MAVCVAVSATPAVVLTYAGQLCARDLLVRPCKAAGAVEQDVVDSIADAPAHRAVKIERVGTLVRALRAKGVARSIEPGAGDVGLQSRDPARRQHEVEADLPASGDAAQVAGWVESGTAVPVNKLLMVAVP
jgi:hypothetical protein